MDQIIKCAAIYDKLENQPHLQDIIKGHYVSSLMSDHDEYDKKKLIESHRLDEEQDLYSYSDFRNKPNWVEPSISACHYAPTLPLGCICKFNQCINDLKFYMKKKLKLKPNRTNFPMHWQHVMSNYDIRNNVSFWVFKKKFKTIHRCTPNEAYAIHIRECASIRIQSVVRGWFVRRETK